MTSDPFEHLDVRATDVADAARRIEGRVHRTPVLTSPSLDALVGARLHLKAEHRQRGGAFKARGAMNAVWSLTDAVAARGVATHSSGNHGAALAIAAAERGVPATVVVPEGAPRVKVEAVVAAGATVIRCAPNLAAREAGLADVLERTGASAIHPSDDPRVIAGAGTVALELLEQVPDLEVLLVPVGGGGLSSGCALWCASAAPHLEVWGVEPSGADDAARSLATGHRLTGQRPDTVADGLRTELSDRTFRILRRHLRGILTVDDTTILTAVELLAERAGQTVEPSGAVALAALIDERHRARFRGRSVGLVVSGGNAARPDPAAPDVGIPHHHR